ncbi:hypothetical protein L195_g034742, partial [Trifolium pratense]
TQCIVWPEKYTTKRAAAIDDDVEVEASLTLELYSKWIYSKVA